MEARGSRNSSRTKSELNSPGPGSNRTRFTKRPEKPEYEFVKIEPRKKRKWESWDDGITDEDFDQMRLDVEKRKLAAAERDAKLAQFGKKSNKNLRQSGGSNEQSLNPKKPVNFTTDYGGTVIIKKKFNIEKVPLLITDPIESNIKDIRKQGKIKITSGESAVQQQGADDGQNKLENVKTQKEKELAAIDQCLNNNKVPS